MSTVIVAKNQTGSPLTLEQLPVPSGSLPASPGEVTLTDYASEMEIQSDSELLAYITAGNVILSVNGVTFTQSGSIAVGETFVSTFPLYGDFYDSGTTDVGTSPTTLALDTVRQNSDGSFGAAFALSGDQVTVQANAGGTYVVRYDVTFGETGGDNRICDLWLELNGSEVRATRAEVVYWTEHGAENNGTAGRSAIITLAPTDVLRVRGQVTAGAANYTTVAGGVGLTIYAIGSNGIIGPAGSDGAQGPAGSGTTITVEDEGANIPNTPHSNLNFVGAGVTAADGGSGVATITIPGGGTANIAQYRQTGNLTIATSATTVVLNANDFEDSNYTRSGENITIDTAGIYRISYSIFFDTTANARRTCDGWVEQNTTEIVPSRASGYTRNNTDDTASLSATFLVQLAATDVIRLRCQSTGTSGTAQGVGNRMWITLEFVRAP